MSQTGISLSDSNYTNSVANKGASESATFHCDNSSSLEKKNTIIVDRKDENAWPAVNSRRYNSEVSSPVIHLLSGSHI